MARSDGQVKRTKPELWESCKKEAEAKVGFFSARTMQYASRLYKERGGGYIGVKDANNSLTLWQKNMDKKKPKLND